MGWWKGRGAFTFYLRTRSLVVEELVVGRVFVSLDYRCHSRYTTHTHGTHTSPALSPPLLQAVFRPELLNRLDEVVVFRPLGAQHAAAIARLELEKTAQRLAERGVGLEASSSAAGRPAGRHARARARVDGCVCGWVGAAATAAALARGRACPRSSSQAADLQPAAPSHPPPTPPPLARAQVTDAALAAVVADGYSASMGARELRRAVMRLVDDELSDALLTGRVRCCPLSLAASQCCCC